jgi:hypothetical protein
MAYALLVKENGSLPTMINEQSSYFCDFIQSGYEIIKEGTKIEIEDEYQEMMQQFEID